MKTIKIIFYLTTLLAVLAVIWLCFWFYALDQDIQKRLEGRRFVLPIQFFASPAKLFTGQQIPFSELLQILEQHNYQKQDTEEVLISDHYKVLSPSDCFAEISYQWIEGLQFCLIFKKKNFIELHYTIAYGKSRNPSAFLSESSKKQTGRILQIYEGDHRLLAEQSIALEPQIFAQYYGQQPILRKVIHLADIPRECIDATLAIEDAHFLEHRGVSFMGMIRAFVKNLQSGRILQGGSTITQQLIKNYFLTSERTFKRKLTEIAMAILLEYRAEKEDILETYLNVLYMGQLGSFEVRGYQKASQYYFGKNIRDLKLHECSLLAGIIRSPGRYNPFHHPERALERRQIVLNRLLDLKKITASQMQEARKQPLPERPGIQPNRSISFFIETVKQELKKLNIQMEAGMNIFTTLDLRAQQLAQESLQKNLKIIEEKTSKKQRLEVALVAADPKTGFVQAIVGGRDFRQSQFNRAYQSKRQIGSIVKPIVYLTALNHEGSVIFTPLTLLEDKKVTIKYQGMQWSPRNYRNRYFQSIPMYYALSMSLNVATAHLGVQIGLDHITRMMQRLGASSELKALPSLLLGAWELSPLEVLQIYSTLANLGQYSKLTFIIKVENAQEDMLYRYVPDRRQVVNAQAVAQLLSMMKQVVQSGTGRGIVRRGLVFPVAGKTGTTNDMRDSWFAGFSPYHVAVLWVGYDNNTSSGLTGASGALPIWTDYMLAFASQYPDEDFPYVEGTKSRTIDLFTQESLGVPQDRLTSFLELTFPESINIEDLIPEEAENP